MKVGFQIGSSEQRAKRAKLDKTISGKGGRVRTNPGPTKPKALVREDLNEDFWNKLAAEEAQRKLFYPHQVVQSPWQKGDATVPKFKFTRTNNPGTTNTVQSNSNKRKLYSKTSMGPEEF